MTSVEEISELAIALKRAITALDRFLLAQERKLPEYYRDKSKFGLCRHIESVAKLRRKLKVMSSILKISESDLRKLPILIEYIPKLLALGNAPKAYASAIKNFQSYGIIPPDAHKHLVAARNKLRTVFPEFFSEIRRNFERRYSRTIDAQEANKSLRGKMNVKVIFHAIQGIPDQEKGVRRTANIPAALEMVANYIDESGLSADAYLRSFAETIFAGVFDLLRDFPEVLTRVYGHKLKIELIVYVYPFEKKGLAGFFERRFRRGGRLIEQFDFQERTWRLILSFREFAERIKHRPPDQVAQNISTLLSHELTHAFDKRYVPKEDASFFDLVRSEGLAVFAEALRQPHSLVVNLSDIRSEHITHFSTFEDLHDACEKNGRLQYTLGLLMSLGIAFYYIKKRHNQIFTTTMDPNQIVQVFQEPSLRKTLLDVHGIINNMKPKNFFIAFQRSVREGVAKELYAERIYAQL